MGCKRRAPAWQGRDCRISHVPSSGCAELNFFCTQSARSRAIAFWASSLRSLTSKSCRLRRVHDPAGAGKNPVLLWALFLVKTWRRKDKTQLRNAVKMLFQGLACLDGETGDRQLAALGYGRRQIIFDGLSHSRALPAFR
jgi:hypothetical protein